MQIGRDAGERAHDGYDVALHLLGEERQAVDQADERVDLAGIGRLREPRERRLQPRQRRL